MTDEGYYLALENSSTSGAVALGCGPDILGVEPIPPRKRHNVDLMVAVDAICRTHGVKPDQLDAVFVSLGPGSFTGLRVAVTTAKMLALTLGIKVVGIPTLELLRAQHPDAVVALNVKRGTAWSAHPPTSGSDGETSNAGLRPIEELQTLAKKLGIPLIADKLDGATPPQPDVATLYRLGHERLTAGHTDDPLTLAPAYIREPEAVTLWDEKENAGNQKTQETQESETA